MSVLEHTINDCRLQNSVFAYIRVRGSCGIKYQTLLIGEGFNLIVFPSKSLGLLENKEVGSYYMIEN